MLTDNRAPDGTPGPHPLDIHELSDRCMGSASVAMLILDKFEKQLRSDLPEIERLLAARDAPTIAHAAHALKGAAGAVAATALRDLAAHIETLAKGDELDSIIDVVATLRAEVDRCIAYLPAARGALQS